MLIEDDELVRSTLADTLAEEGIEVNGLANAEDALILLSSGQAPDVLVADIDLGAGLNGLDLAGIARERHPHVEVIIISGTTPSADQRALHGRQRFVAKPFAPAALADAIRGAVGEARR